MKHKTKIIELINKGVSIPKISKSLNIRRSTIYYHYKKIKGRKYKLVKKCDNDKILGEFLGAFAGDGSFFFDKKNYHYRISIHLHAKDDRNYGFYLKKLIENNFNKKVRCYFVKGNALILNFYSKKIYELIKKFLYIEKNKTLNVKLNKSLYNLSDDFLIYFMRGLMDTDGHVNKNSQIILALISKEMILQSSKILDKFGIDNKIFLRKKEPNKHQLYELKILKRNSSRYKKIIGFSNKCKENRLIENAPAEIRIPGSD